MKSIKFSCWSLCTLAFCLPRFNEKNSTTSFSYIGLPVSWMILPLWLGVFFWWTFPCWIFLPSSPAFLTNVPQIMSAEILKKCCYSTVLYVTATKHIGFVSQTGNKWASESSSDFPMASLTVNDKMRLERGPSDFKISSLWMVPYYVLVGPVFFSIPLLWKSKNVSLWVSIDFSGSHSISPLDSLRNSSERSNCNL